MSCKKRTAKPKDVSQMDEMETIDQVLGRRVLVRIGNVDVEAGVVEEIHDDVIVIVLDANRALRSVK